LIYTEHIKLAKSKDAEVIVFPEFGLTATENTKERSDLYPFAVRIPSPSTLAPCDNSSLNNSSSSLNILYTMSCAARENKILVLINTIDWVDCDQSIDASCPADSHYQYNTDILFNENGEIVAKYHKSHEWPGFADVYDQVLEPSQVTYKSSFGVTFGLFICFDIMFDDPPKVLRKEGVEHFLYAVKQGEIGLNTLIKDWSKHQKAVVLAANLGAGSRLSSDKGSDCSGIIVNGTIVEAAKYTLGTDYPNENILVATIMT
jgi:predicted amidohydrolase